VASPRIVALGGHEFSARPPELAIVRHLLELTGAERPRVCLLPTAGGDPWDGIASFHSVMGRYAAEATHVSLFRLERERVDLREHLLSQDLIYVAGGSMLNLIAIWRAHGLDRILADAWRAGVLLAGQSAGAMCWFEHGITASAGAPRVAGGLGLLPGSLSVHLARDPARRELYLEEVAGGLPGGYALDDGAGLVFAGKQLAGAFAGPRGARAFRLEREGRRAVETELRPIVLAHESGASEDPALAERRALRRMRSAVR
jgi:peptidase E